MEQGRWAVTPSNKAQNTSFVQAGHRNAGNRTGIVMGSKRQAPPQTSSPQPLTYKLPPTTPTKTQQLSYKLAPKPPARPGQQSPAVQSSPSPIQQPVLDVNFPIPSPDLQVNFPTTELFSQNVQTQANVTFSLPPQEPASSAPIQKSQLKFTPMASTGSYITTGTTQKDNTFNGDCDGIPVKILSTPKTNMKTPVTAKGSGQMPMKTVRNPQMVAKTPVTAKGSRQMPTKTDSPGLAKMRLPPPPPTNQKVQNKAVPTNIIHTATSSVSTLTTPTITSTVQSKKEEEDGTGKKKGIVSKSIEWYNVTVSVIETRGLACKNPFVVGKVDDIIGHKGKPLKSVSGDPKWDNETFVVGCYRNCEYNGNVITLEIFENEKLAAPQLLGMCKVPVERKEDLTLIGASEWLSLRQGGVDESNPICGEVRVKVMASPAPRVVFESPLLKKHNLLKFRPVHVVLFEPSRLIIYENSAYTNELERINIGDDMAIELYYSERRITLKVNANSGGVNVITKDDDSNGGVSRKDSIVSFPSDALDFISFRSKTVEYTFSGGKPFIRNWVNVLRKFCTKVAEEKTLFPVIANALSPMASASSGSLTVSSSSAATPPLPAGSAAAAAGGASTPSMYYGVTLAKLTERGLCTSNGVPKFVQTLIDTIARRGLEAEGIFRVNGTISEVNAARARLEEGGEFLLPNESVYVVAGLLKLFLRELPEPVFTFELYQRFINSVLIADYEESKREMKSVMADVPKENRAFLKELVSLLCKVCDKAAINKMNSSNLSIVFAPTLIWSDTV